MSNTNLGSLNEYQIASTFFLIDGGLLFPSTGKVTDFLMNQFSMC